jgi:hypothetical protein
VRFFLPKNDLDLLYFLSLCIFHNKTTFLTTSRIIMITVTIQTKRSPVFVKLKKIKR